MKTFYDWLIAEIKEWGYGEDDVVALSSDSNEAKVMSLEEFKKISNVLIKVFEKVPDPDEPYITIFDGFNIHFKDGSIGQYTNSGRCYDYDVHENGLTLIKSLSALGTVESLELKMGYTQQESFKDDLTNLDKILGYESYRKTKVNIAKNIEMDDYYVIHATGYFLPAIILSTKDGTIGFNFDVLRLDEIEDYIGFIQQFPIISDELFEQNISTLFVEMAGTLIPEEKKSKVPSFKGITDFFMAASEKEKNNDSV